MDETGGQIAILGRLGSRPFNREEQRKLYLDQNGAPWFVHDRIDMQKFVPGQPGRSARRKGRSGGSG